jgi:hypothetical protein
MTGANRNEHVMDMPQLVSNAIRKSPLLRGGNVDLDVHLTLTQLRVYMFICEHPSTHRNAENRYETKDESVAPSHTEIALALRISTRTVARCVHELIDKGYVQASEVCEGAQRLGTRYVLLFTDRVHRQLPPFMLMPEGAYTTPERQHQEGASAPKPGAPPETSAVMQRHEGLTYKTRPKSGMNGSGHEFKKTRKKSTTSYNNGPSGRMRRRRINWTVIM